MRRVEFYKERVWIEYVVNHPEIDSRLFRLNMLIHLITMNEPATKYASELYYLLYAQY